MPWIRPAERVLARLLRLSATVWLCHKVGNWALSFRRLSELVLRFVRRTHSTQRLPNYGHLLLDVLYPGRRPSAEASKRATELAAESRRTESAEEALQLLGEAVLLSPPDASLYLIRAEVHSRHGQLVEALDNAELCVSLDAACAAGWLRKGQTEEALGRAADAELSYQAGLQASPEHEEMRARLAALRAEPAPNLLRQLRDFVAAGRLGLETLFRDVEDPEKITETFVESNSTLLDSQLELLGQTLRVNTVVLLDSPMLCEAYEQIVYTCTQLVACAPGAFSRRLRNAGVVLEGLSLALRVGWQVHHSVPKLAANALVTLASSAVAEDGLRRQAVRHLLSGMLRWLLDARPEPDREVEEVCGCGCSVPWQAAACFLDRFFEPTRPQSWIREECEAWPDVAQLCQWLTLSARDYHATPFGLVGLLQMHGVAKAVMRSEAIVNFFIAPPLLDDGDESPTEDGGEEPADPGAAGQPMTSQAVSAAATHTGPVVRVANASTIDGALLPPAQRLGEWLMASIAYLFLFVEGDALFTVCACRALQTLIVADPDGDGTGRLLRSVWLGIPFLNKLSFCACNHTAAFDLLHTLLQSEHRGVRVAARSLAQALARPPPLEIAALQGEQAADQEEDAVDEGVAAIAMEPSQGSSGSGGDVARMGTAIVTMVTASTGPNLTATSHDIMVATRQAAAAVAERMLVEEPHMDEEAVPSWAEFYQELLNELAMPPSGKDEVPELVTLFNFEEKAPFLAENASICALPGNPEEHAAVEESKARATVKCASVPAAWNRFTEASQASRLNDSNGLLVLFHAAESEADIGSEEFMDSVQQPGCVVLMSRRSIRQSSFVHNWAQAVSAAEKVGASAVIVYNNLDGMEPFRMGLFGEPAPSIPAFMVSGKDGAALSSAAAEQCSILISRSLPNHSGQGDDVPVPPPWPLTGGRLPTDVAQAWSLLDAMSSDDPLVLAELESLLSRMSVPEKRVWLTRRLVRYHRWNQAPDGGVADPPLAFVEGDRSLPPKQQLGAIRQQMCEEIGLGAGDVCGEFEVRFKGEQGVGSGVLREWMDLVAREAFLHPCHRLLKSYDHRQTFWPDPAAVFCNPQWKMDYEALGRLLGLALWQSCTLDLPLHPHICGLLFGFCRESLGTTLQDVDDDLDRLKAKWLLSNPVDALGFELPFSDSLAYEEAPQEEPSLHTSSASSSGSSSQSAAPADALPQVLTPEDRLAGGARTWPGRRLSHVGLAEVALSPDPQRQVTDDNKAEFVDALREWRLCGSIKAQVAAMAHGLGQVVPDEILSELRGLFAPVEMAGLLSGLGEINVDDWEKHTAYSQGLDRSSDLVSWFWRTVRGWASSAEGRTLLPQLLQFVTGSARVPVGGFRELVGINGARHPFTLSKGSHLKPQSLPMAHACICTLDLPPFGSYETCQAKMTQMLSLGRAYFDDAAGQQPSH